MATVNLSNNASYGPSSPDHLDMYNVHPRTTWSAVVILIISVVGNSLVVAAFIRDRRLRVVFNTLVLTLSVADILMSLILMLEIISLSYHHPIFAESAILCRFVSILVNAIPTEQLILSHMMCNDRHKAFLRRLAYCQVRQQHNESLRLAVTWAFSLTASFLITDIMIILEHGQFSLCFFPDRPLYVSKMAYIHSFLLVLLVISLIYIVRDFRKRRNKKPYFIRLGPDVEPGLENYLDNRTSSQCLIPRSPVNIYRNNHVSLSPKAFHQFIQQDDKITSGDGKSHRAVPPLDVTTFNSGKTSPTAAVDQSVTRKGVLDWQIQNDSDKKHKDGRISHYMNLSSEAIVVGNTHLEEEVERQEKILNLKNIAHISRAEKRLMIRRGAIYERCCSETCKSVRIVDLNVEKIDTIKSSNHMSRLEVEASSNSQDDWSHSSCSFSEEETTDILMPRFKPRTDSMYTLRSCLSTSEEANNFEAINMEESSVNSGDIIDHMKIENGDIQVMIQTNKEYRKDIPEVFDTLMDTCSQNGDEISGVNDGKEHINLMKFDSELEPNLDSMRERYNDCIHIDSMAENEINKDLVHFCGTKLISIVNQNEPSNCSEFTTTQTDLDRCDTSQTQWEEDDKCNNYYGSECESKSKNRQISGNNISLNVMQKNKMSQLSSDDVEMSDKSDQIAKNNDQISPSNSPMDIDVAARDWISFYNVRRKSSDNDGESLESLQADTSTSITYGSNERIGHVNISGKEMASTYIENKGDKSIKLMNLDINNKCNPYNSECISFKREEDGANKVEGSGDNLSKLTLAKQNLLQQPNIGDMMICQSKLSSISVDDKTTVSSDVKTLLLPTVLPTDSASPTSQSMCMSLPENETEYMVHCIEKNNKEQLEETDNMCDQHDSVSSDVHADSSICRNVDMSDSIPPVQEIIRSMIPVCTSHMIKSSDKFGISVLDDCHTDEKNHLSPTIEQGHILVNPFEMKSEQLEGKQQREALFTSPVASDTSMSPLQFLDSLSVTRRAYLAEIGLYQDVLAGQVMLDASLLEMDHCPPCPYCLEKENTSTDWDELSEISSSEASSMTEFTLGDVDRLVSRSLLSESRRKQLKFLADSSSNNLAPSEHLRSSFRTFYMRSSSENWCETSPECPVFTTDISDNFRHRKKVYNTCSPPFKKVKKLLSFEIIKSYDPELSILISLLLLTLLQVICWLPLTSLYVYFNIHNFPHKMEVQEFHYILLWLVRMALQPFIYIYYSKCFRMNFIYFLSCGFYNYRK